MSSINLSGEAWARPPLQKWPEIYLGQMKDCRRFVDIRFGCAVASLAFDVRQVDGSNMTARPVQKIARRKKRHRAVPKAVWLTRLTTQWRAWLECRKIEAVIPPKANRLAAIIGHIRGVRSSNACSASPTEELPRDMRKAINDMGMPSFAPVWLR